MNSAPENPGDKLKFKATAPGFGARISKTGGKKPFLKTKFLERRLAKKGVGL